MVLRRVAHRLGRLRREFIRNFNQALDEEQVKPFHYTYLIIFIVAGLYLLLFAQGAPQNVEPVMGHGSYLLWCGLNVACPVSTLVGKHFTKKSAGLDPHTPNPALGAAWLQFTGDFGVWATVVIYLICFAQTSYWGQSVYGVFFVFMGVPGGFYFTLRSVRRIRQINRRASRL